MYKIHFFLNALGIGGTEKTALLFAEYMNRTVFDVSVFTYKNSDLTRLSQFQSVCNVVLLDRDNPDWRSLEDCDIVHSFRSGYKETPEPGIEINPPHFVETNIFGFIDQNPQVERTLFMSKWLMDNTLRGAVHERFDYVNNPVEFSYEVNPVSRIPSDIIWLGRCGRPDNGIYNSVSVDAVRLLRMQGYDVRFRVVAPPSNMINDLTEYDIPFEVIEPTIDPLALSKFYSSIDIYAHARADGETFGVNIAEAMIHSKPVVTHIATPSVPGMGVFQSQTELVDNGETGFIVNNDPGEYANALKALIDDKQKAIAFGKAGRQKAQEEYHVINCVNKLQNIYGKMMFNADNNTKNGSI